MEDIVMLRSRRTREKGPFGGKELLVVAVVFAVVFACGSVYAKVAQKIFSSPEKAVEAMVEAVKTDDIQSLLAIFGPGSRHIILSGDPVEDQKGHEWFLKHYEEKNRLEEASGKATLHVGNDRLAPSDPHRESQEWLEVRHGGGQAGDTGAQDWQK